MYKLSTKVFRSSSAQKVETRRGEEGGATGRGLAGGGGWQGAGAERWEGQRGVRAAARGRHGAAGAVGWVEGAGPGGGG